MKKNWVLATCAFATLWVSFLAGARPGRAESCSITFDDWWALAGLLDQARYTYARKTSKLDSGPCTDANTYPDSRLKHPYCREYEQGCFPNTGPSAISVWEQSQQQPWDHFHLDFEDERLNGGAGCPVGKRNINGVCTEPANYYSEPRKLSTMGNAWLEIVRIPNDPSALQTLVFNLSTIHVGRNAIQLWFRRTDGSVAGWSNLGPNTNWGLGGQANGITHVWISSIDGHERTFLNGFTVTN